MHILITGGTGFLGRSLATSLLDEGHTVRIFARDPAAVADLRTRGAEVIRGDLRDRAAGIAACAGVDVVHHAGALSAPWGPAAEFYATNVGGTRAIVDGCLRHGVRRLIYISSPSVVFAGEDQHNLTEAAPYPAQFISEYSRTKKLGEDLVNWAAPRMETVILRPKAIFGPGDRSLLPRLIGAARTRRLPLIGDGRNLVDLTYVENVAHAMRLAMTADLAIGRTYHITNDEHPLLWEVVRRALRELRLPTALRRAPLPVARAAAGAMERAALVTGHEPTLTRYSALILARTQTYDIAAAKRDLGYRPLITLEEGMTRTITALHAEELARVGDFRHANHRLHARGRRQGGAA